MKKIKTIPVLVLATGLATGPVLASEELAQKHGCMACHGVDKKLVGPAFKDIAVKYKAEKGAVTLLARHVRGGSKGVWGNAVMPPQAGISDDNLGKVVRWILQH
ncbi:MAG: c-type cytochrome [Hydrogenophilaceae bacterium]|nr:c-type cytochrome [Hydrogenophilaceae bacterium]